MLRRESPLVRIPKLWWPRLSSHNPSRKLSPLWRPSASRRRRILPPSPQLPLLWTLPRWIPLNNFFFPALFLFLPPLLLILCVLLLLFFLFNFPKKSMTCCCYFLVFDVEASHNQSESGSTSSSTVPPEQKGRSLK